MATTMITRQYPDKTWAWTLTTILGDSLKKAEQRFGKRDSEYAILGIEFVDLPVPYLWFLNDSKQIVIRLTLPCKDDFSQGVFQLAHEVVHCLSPVKAGEATILEEGLATLFSKEYSINHGRLVPADQKYLNACNLAEQLLKIDKEIIKKLRNVQPTISLITEANILSVNNSIPVTLAHDLSQRF